MTLKRFVEAIWDAKPYRPDGIIDGKSLLEVVTTPNPPCAYDYPYQGLQKKLHGIRYGELICQSPVDPVKESRPSVESLQLIYSRLGNELEACFWRNPTDVQLSD
jgi:hypothetical protein